MSKPPTIDISIAGTTIRPECASNAGSARNLSAILSDSESANQQQPNRQKRSNNSRSPFSSPLPMSPHNPSETRFPLSSFPERNEERNTAQPTNPHNDQKTRHEPPEINERAPAVLHEIVRIRTVPAHRIRHPRNQIRGHDQQREVVVP